MCIRDRLKAKTVGLSKEKTHGHNLLQTAQRQNQGLLELRNVNITSIECTVVAIMMLQFQCDCSDNIVIQFRNVFIML